VAVAEKAWSSLFVSSCAVCSREREREREVEECPHTHTERGGDENAERGVGRDENEREW
jgi:hypothetical protein